MISESDSEEYTSATEYVPLDILEEAKDPSLDTLPTVSRLRYTKTYNEFKVWRKSRNTNSFCEEVLLVYFKKQAETMAPSTMWARYSMLKCTINAYDKINIGTYSRLTNFLKKSSKNFKSQKAKTFTEEQLRTFLTEAPDAQYLANKVACVFGIAGACRRSELCEMNMKDLDDRGNRVLFISLPKTKTGVVREFTIMDEFYDIYKKYISLRPENVKGDKVFANYQKGKCTRQTIGLNKFGAMPKEIAIYLKLPNPESYTGHSFRRTAATTLANSGGKFSDIKRLGGWKSNQVVESYIDDCDARKKRTCQQITGSIMSDQSSSKKRVKIAQDVNVGASSSKDGDQYFIKPRLNVSSTESTSTNSDPTVNDENSMPSSNIEVPKNVSIQLINYGHVTITYEKNKAKRL